MAKKVTLKVGIDVKSECEKYKMKSVRRRALKVEGIELFPAQLGSRVKLLTSEISQ